MTQICLMSLNQESNILFRRSIIFKNRPKLFSLSTIYMNKCILTFLNVNLDCFSASQWGERNRVLWQQKYPCSDYIMLLQIFSLLLKKKKKSELVRICYSWIIFIYRNSSLIYLLNRFVRCWQWIRFWDEEKMYLFMSNNVAFWY